MTHASEIQSGSRFTFGENWRRFLALIGERRIGAAENSLKAKLGHADLSGLSFTSVRRSAV